MEKPVFDSVDWGAVNLALSNKFRMYQLWYGKQCSGWCRTGNRLKYWEKEVDTRYPNCFEINETAGHLMSYAVVLTGENFSLTMQGSSKVRYWSTAHILAFYKQSKFTFNARGNASS